MPKWVIPALVIVFVLLLLYFFGGVIWSTLMSLLLAIVHIIVAIAEVIINFFVQAFFAALPILTIVAATAIILAAIVLAFGVVLVLAIAIAEAISKKLVVLAEQMRRLRVDFKAETRQTAVTGAFLALVAILCTLITYIGTDDFLDHVSAVRFFAACGIGLVAAKLFFFFPSRIAKASGLFLTFLILASSIALIVARYGFVQGMGVGFRNLRVVFMDPHNELKVLLCTLIALLSFLTLWFPFTRNEWRQLLAVPRQQLPDSENSSRHPAAISTD
jgi:hypothetical protein